jgi:uncharacterized membrane protein (UPF0127 family)
VYSLAFWLAAALPVAVVHAPHADLTLEVARTEAQREHGLMNRTQIAPHTGMIFVFGGDGPVAFWMKNTLVPLDMLFIAADGTVRRVFSNVAVVPRSLPDADIPREADVGKYVIELPAGEAAKDGIAAGVRLDLRGVPTSI